MEEEASCRAVPGLSRAMSRRGVWGLLVLGLVALVSCLIYFHCDHRCAGQPCSLQTGSDMAELQLNLTGPRQDPRLRWQAGPSLGRSFLHGPALDDGQLRVLHDGIYRLHIQHHAAAPGLWPGLLCGRPAPDEAGLRGHPLHQPHPAGAALPKCLRDLLWHPCFLLVKIRRP
ncbi:CD70 antigen [Octodon degus]|uniref:CD70 antigen n=1 Tax=Octodon degus TaxID=10160 RepID=A0A6P6EKW4_OCTDE|nr:CD70 antigen [Octodon degus]